MSKPRYKHPALLETVFELRFPPDNSWGISSFIEFANLASKQNYTKIVDAVEGFQFNFSASGNEPPQVKPVSRRIQTWNEEGTQLWQASPELYAANRRKPYQGWETFLPHILKGFDLYKQVANPTKAEVLAMNYINRIDVDISKHNPSDYITFLPPSIAFADSITNLSCQTEQQFDDNDTIVVIVSRDLSEPREGVSILLNILYTTKEPNLDTNKLVETIQKAHSRVIDAFEKSITDKQRERMEPR